MSTKEKERNILINGIFVGVVIGFLLGTVTGFAMMAIITRLIF